MRLYAIFVSNSPRFKLCAYIVAKARCEASARFS